MSIYLTAERSAADGGGLGRLLPAWFTRLHQRYHTPVNSILAGRREPRSPSACWASPGVGMQEATSCSDNAAGIFYASTYVVLFAIPLFAAGRIGLQGSTVVAGASASGAVVSLLYIGLTAVLIVEVENRLMFAVKLIGVALVLNLLGVHARGATRRQRQRLAASGASESSSAGGAEAAQRRNASTDAERPAGQRRDRDMGARRCIGRGEGDPVVRPGVPPVERNRQRVRPAAVVEQRQIRNAHEPIGASARSWTPA